METISFIKEKKGFVFTLDAILAILATVVILISIYSILSNVNTVNNDDLHKITLSSLAILEKNNYLSNGVNGNFSNINNFLNSLPSQICANISLYNVDNNIINSNKKNGCSSSDNLVVGRRVFVSDYNVYYAKMEAWYE